MVVVPVVVVLLVVICCVCGGFSTRSGCSAGCSGFPACHGVVLAMFVAHVVAAVLAVPVVLSVLEMTCAWLSPRHGESKQADKEIIINRQKQHVAVEK